MDDNERHYAAMAQQIREAEDRRILEELAKVPHCALCGTTDRWMLDLGVVDGAGNCVCVRCELEEANNHG